MTATMGDALALSTIGHSGKMYGTRPYIEHPIAVAHLILKQFGPEPRLLVPALLHDVVEDCGITLNELAYLGYRPDDINTIDAVTRRHNENYLDFVRRAARHDRGLIVKLADNTHNLSGLPAGDLREGRYLKARRILLDHLGGADPWYGMCPTVDHIKVES